MIKKTFALIVVSSLVSAALLFIGLSLLGQFSPALASSLDALVAGTSLQDPAASIPADSSSPVELKPRTYEVQIASDPKIDASLPLPAGPSQTEPVIVTTPAASVTITELLNNPGKYEDEAFTVTGILTILNDHSFLLNDGTGQILLKVEDELSGLALLGGMTITVMGDLDHEGNTIVLELDACSLTDQSGSILLDDCTDDDQDDSSLSDDDSGEDDDDGGISDDDADDDDTEDDDMEDGMEDDVDDDMDDDEAGEED